MRGASQVQAMCLGGDWEVHARYMRGTCEVRAYYKPGESGLTAWRVGLIADTSAVSGHSLRLGLQGARRFLWSPPRGAGPSALTLPGSGLLACAGEPRV